MFRHIQLPDETTPVCGVSFSTGFKTTKPVLDILKDCVGPKGLFVRDAARLASRIEPAASV